MRVMLQHTSQLDEFMIAEGKEFVVLKGHLKDVASECVDLKNQGYSVVKVKRKILWPIFWRPVYKVRLKRDFIVDFETGRILLTPIDSL